MIPRRQSIHPSLALLLGLVSAFFFLPSRTAQAQAVDVSVAVGPEVDPDAFRPALSPYGEWVEVPGYGMVWRPYPSLVGADFVPYASNGHWVYSDDGWVWVSDYDWGWAPFHYGNWVFVDDSWAWIPGSVWAPAWVEWRFGGGYVGWAPLGPVGYVPRYCYVGVNRFTEVNVRAHVVVGVRAEAIAVHTEPLRSAQYVSGHPIAPVGAGPRATVIAQATGHPVTAVPMHTLTSATPPSSVHGVHYAAGTGPQHAVVTRKLPAETAHAFAPEQQAVPSHAKAAPRSVAAAPSSASHGETKAPAPAPHAEEMRPAPVRQAQPQPRPRPHPRPAEPEGHEGRR